MLSHSLLPTRDHVLRARDHVLRTGAGLLRTSRIPGHLSTPVLGPLQDNLLRPTGYGLGLLRLELPCAGVVATLPRIQKSGHQLEGALVQSPPFPVGHQPQNGNVQATTGRSNRRHSDKRTKLRHLQLLGKVHLGNIFSRCNVCATAFKPPYPVLGLLLAVTLDANLAQ